jgi:hypothetical protein
VVTVVITWVSISADVPLRKLSGSEESIWTRIVYSQMILLG